MEKETCTVSIYLSINDVDEIKIEKLKAEIIQAIKDILAKDTPPKDIHVSFVWY